MKTCKQCGEHLPDTSYRQYKSRSTGKRQRPTGCSPVCKSCESFNAMVTAAYKANPRTPRQEAIVSKATQVYMYQLQRGLQPNGPLARSLYPDNPNNVAYAIDKYFAKHLPPDMPPDIQAVEDPVTKALLELMESTIDDDTERKLYALMEQCNDGNDDPEQKMIINNIWELIDEYDEQQ